MFQELDLLQDIHRNKCVTPSLLLPLRIGSLFWLLLPLCIVVGR